MIIWELDDGPPPQREKSENKTKLQNATKQRHAKEGDSHLEHTCALGH